MHYNACAQCKIVYHIKMKKYKYIYEAFLKNAEYTV